MLIEFRVENHRSLRDEQVLSMEAAPRVGDPADPRPRKVAGARKPLLPVAAIYGANASGKSTVLEAIAFMRDFVQSSHFTFTARGVPRSPFAWGEAPKAPSRYEVEVVLDGERWRYGFVLSDLKVEEERLYAWTEGRRRLLFDRLGEAYRFGEHFKGENEVVRRVTRPDALYLSTAAQHRHPGVQALYRYFAASRRGNAPSGYRDFRMAVLHEASYLGYTDKSIRDHILPLLKHADVGITDFRVKDQTKSTLLDPFGEDRFEFQHAAGDDDAWLTLNQESMGTRALFHNAGGILQVIAEGTFLLLDELDSSLHPAIAERIVNLFNDPASNPRNAQLIFTTHNTNLLGNTVGEPALRRDQVWLTEKDRDGATELYPLTDFKPRKAENLERGYLQGRYGAVPFLGDFATSGE